MRSAVEALAYSPLGARTPTHKRYAPMCICCAPEAQGLRTGKPQRIESARPVLPWRTRLALFKTAFEAVDSAGAATK